MRRHAALGLELGSWAAVLVLAWAALAVTSYRARDPDSRLYAEIAARTSQEPAERWIAPTFPPGSYMSGLFREHPAGLHVVPALLARLGYPAEQAAYAVNAVYQVLTVLLVQRLVSVYGDGLEARASGWLIQLIPIAFTFRIRANHEQAVVMLLLAALVGLERSRSHGAWAALTVTGLVGILLVKGIFVLPALAVCLLWLLVGRPNGSRRSVEPWCWGGLGLALVSLLAVAWVYEQAYRSATGEPFWSFYLGRQLGVAAAAESAAWFGQKAYNLVWYVGRIVWFPFPWSVALLCALAYAWRRRATPGTAWSGLLFTAGVAVLYVLGFSLSDRRADRYLFPAYYVVAAGGIVAALRGSPRFRNWAERLDRPWLVPLVFLVTFGLHLFAGRLGLPTIKVWAPDG